MSEALLAVQGMTVIPDPLSGVEATIVVAPATAPVLGEDLKAHVDGDSITVTNITVPAALATIPDPGPYTVECISSSEYGLTNALLLLKEGDETEAIDATPQIPPVPPAVDPVDFPVTFKCIVDAAGQTSVYIQ